MPWTELKESSVLLWNSPVTFDWSEYLIDNSAVALTVRAKTWVKTWIV
jgi:hypothetical protein